MRLAVLTAIHARHAVARAMLRHTASLIPDRPVGLAILTPEQAKRMGPECEAAGWLWAAASNRPLSRKWNAGLVALSLRIAPDAVMILGSDDFASPAYLEVARAAIADAPAAESDAVWMLSRETGHLALWRGRVGAGRILRWETLEAVGWDLWPEARESSLDALAGRTLEAAGLTFGRVDADPYHAPVVAAKSPDGDMHPWGRLRYSHVLDPEPARAHLARWRLGGMQDLVQ